MPQVAAVDVGGGNGSSPVASAIVAAGVEIRPSTPATTGGGMRIRPIDEESQRPLQPVESWENLVDQLAASESYMELAGQHSGLGHLFSIIGRRSSGCSRIISVFMARLPNCFSRRM